MSDPSGRRPIGIITRPAPDWFSDSLAIAGFQLQSILGPPGNYYFRISLYNNALDGSVLKVYGVTICNDGGGGLVFWYNNGPIGTFQQNATALRPDRPTPPGQIYFDQQIVPAGGLNPFIVSPIIGQIGVAGFDSFTVTSPFPLFIIPPGWALVGADPGSSLSDGATFWYQVSEV